MQVHDTTKRFATYHAGIFCRCCFACIFIVANLAKCFIEDVSLYVGAASYQIDIGGSVTVTHTIHSTTSTLHLRPSSIGKWTLKCVGLEFGTIVMKCPLVIGHHCKDWRIQIVLPSSSAKVIIVRQSSRIWNRSSIFIFAGGRIGDKGSREVGSDPPA